MGYVLACGAFGLGNLSEICTVPFLRPPGVEANFEHQMGRDDACRGIQCPGLTKTRFKSSIPITVYGIILDKLATKLGSIPIFVAWL
jgi:hypothetical protein